MNIEKIEKEFYAKEEQILEKVLTKKIEEAIKDNENIIEIYETEISELGKKILKEKELLKLVQEKTIIKECHENYFNTKKYIYAFRNIKEVEEFYQKEKENDNMPSILEIMIFLIAVLLIFFICFSK